ncbi:phage portal protein [Lactococcus hircilactis]|uniref:Phage portal protein n=1 Tax=Lactococcus hircilactis TaxID=1494462 RepID=A0A7X1ZCN1_9LACT|nr:phage portal protein [Lactococcus hircilactis]MQW40650.1 phage portal protein [Lactococcus hircilactis]
MEFNLFGKVVKIQSSKLNQQTQRADAWNTEIIQVTSGFYNNISAKIASEISKLNFQHVKYKKVAGGADTLSSLDGSDIDEALNWSPKGYSNSVEFWTTVTKRLLTTIKVNIKIITNSDGTIKDLKLLDGDETVNDNETINLVSPFFINQNTSILDSTLSSIATKLQQGRMRGMLKVNALIDETDDDFKEKALKTITTMQEVSNYNGLGVMDGKSEIVEFKNSYSVLNDEEIKLIKEELLSSYFMSESILTGKASQEEQILFYNSTIIPLLNQLEKELSYKLISQSKRRNIQGNLYYERIIVDNQLFKFASLKDLIDLYHENTQAPFLTVNEFKTLAGLEPSEGGDVYLTNANSMMIENYSDLKGLPNDDNSDGKDA